MHKFIHRLFHGSTFLIIAIILFGAYLRLHRISEYMTFLGDEGRDMLIVKRMLVDHKFTLLGPTASVGGFFLGPIYYYFMLPFVWLFHLDPIGPAIMVALFGVATIYLVYRFASEVFDEITGLLCASLYAISPLVIAYSRSSWNPNIVPFFSTALMYVLWKTSFNRNKQLLFYVGIIFGIGLQLHYLFLFLFPVIVIFLFFYRYKESILYYLYGLVGFIIGYSFFLIFEIRHGFPNTRSIIQFIFFGKETGFIPQTMMATMSDVLYRLYGRLIFRIPPPEQLNSYTNIWQYMWPLSVWCTIIATLCASIAYVIHVIVSKRIKGLPKENNNRFSAIILFLFWLGVPILLFGLYHKGIYDYYFGLFFALPFLLVGMIIWLLRQSRIGQIIAYILVSILLYINWLGMPFRTPGNNQLRQTKTIARAALDKTNGQKFNFALMTGANSDHAYRYFFEIWGNPPVVIENYDNDPKRTTVTDQLIVICEQSDCHPLGSPLWEIAGFGRADITDQWPISFVNIIRLVHYKGV
jgi:4-amino-4-deoxy-L-arabinose transferase-like glycosyltransferase